MLVSKYISFLSKTTACSSLNLTRHFAFKSDLPIKWYRPEKIPSYKPEKSGDGTPFIHPEPTALLPHYDQCEELKDADDIVRKIFSFEHNKRNFAVLSAKYDMMTSVNRHQADVSSIEATRKSILSPSSSI